MEMHTQRPESPNDKSRRPRPKLLTSTRVIILVLVLAAICLLWTTEWMDRLQVFGNTLSYTGFVANPSSNVINKASESIVPLEKEDADKVYEVFEIDENQVPITSNGNEIVESDKNDGGDEIPEIIEESDPVVDEEERESDTVILPETQALVESDEAEVSSKPPATQRLSICVVSSNPRTASIFYSKTLQRIGAGKFDYVVAPRKCPVETQASPVTVRMLYQKSLTSLAQNQIDAMFDSPENLIVVMGDEYCRCPVEVCSQRAHARQYYSEAYVEYATKHPSQEGSPTVYLPLGARVDFPPVTDSEWLPSSKRKLLFNLIVSPTSPSRKRLVTMVNRNTKTFNPVFVHMTPAFAGNASEAKGYISPEDFRKTLLDSKFTLCPAGHNPEAFRLFEACETGSIPIIVKDDEYKNHGCKDSFAPLIASGAPFIVLDSWEDLADAIKPFQKDAAKLDAQQKKLKEWYTRLWRETARDFECSIAQNLERIMKRNPDLGFKAENFDMPECLSDDAEREEDVKLSNNARPALPPPKASSKITPTPLIVGCGRTGTLSLSHYIVKSVGVRSVHEKMEPSAISVSWLYAVPDAPQYPFEGKKSPPYRRSRAKRLARMNLPLFSPVVHLVRHPLKVISSTRRCFCGRGTRSTGLGQASDARSWQFVDSNIKMPKPNLPYDSLVRSMTYWYEWNKLIEARHKIAARFRIEDLDPNALVSALGLTLPPGAELPNRVPRAPSHVSPDEEKEILPDATWADLANEDLELAENIFELAQQYGYEPQAKTLQELI